MKRVKKPKNKNPRYEISDKQVKRIKQMVAEEATQKASLIAIAVMADDLNMNEDQICSMAQKISRYARYIDDNVIRINEIADIIHEKTGLKFSRF